jgi:hypothetical protein
MHKGVVYLMRRNFCCDPVDISRGHGKPFLLSAAYGDASASCSPAASRQLITQDGLSGSACTQ